ncbi:MAG: DUF2997 domain-containing protein [Deltaproteobacteria bacterium]|nr:DUF2997 domain-containing protein [Deltaproteobacteria bacterium]
MEIDIQISPDGKVTFGVKGVKGKKCKELTKFLEEELGEVLNTQLTSEYYQEETVVRKDQIEIKK